MSQVLRRVGRGLRRARPPFGPVLALALVLSGCGQTGPLSLPDRSAAPEPEPESAETGREPQPDDEQTNDDER